MRILIIGQDFDFVGQLSSLMKTKDYEVLISPETTNLPGLINNFGAQLIIYELPLQGFDVSLNQCKQLRIHSEVLLLVITQATLLENKLDAFAAGADDYLLKPFDVRELHARILALLKRHPQIRMSYSSHLVHLTPDVELDPHRQIIIAKGQKFELRPLEFKLLAHFSHHPNIALSREQLLEAVWGYDYFGNTREVDVYVHHLRQIIEPTPNEPQYIRTVWGTGYIFSPEL